MKHVQGMAFAWVVCGLWLAACGGLELEAYEEERGEALCNRQARCGEIRDKQACVRAAREHNRILREAGMQPFARFAGSLETGRMRFDEDRAEECVDLILYSSCEQSLDEITRTEECAVLVGQRKDGEACLIHEDCGATSYCDRETQSATCAAGTCKSIRPGEGVPGRSDLSACSPRGPDEVWDCPLLSGENGPCSDNLSCVSFLYCDPSRQQCRRPGRVGERCDPQGTRPCLPHLRCAEGSCRELANVGEACTYSHDGAPGRTPDCKRDLFCDVGADSLQGTCQERHAVGSACPNYIGCQASLFCALGPGLSLSCRERVREGGACNTFPCAVGLTCSVGTFTCIRMKQEGAACESTNNAPPFPCLPGLDCIEGTCRVSFPGLCGAP